MVDKMERKGVEMMVQMKAYQLAEKLVIQRVDLWVEW
jgi:hypothetical protein